MSGSEIQMERESTTLSIQELRRQFVDIEFPDYQREPDVWSRDQKQRLIDSILRRFDISSVYFYNRDDGGRECIDGRQRLNAIMSFVGENPADMNDQYFPIRLENEISSGLQTAFDELDGFTYKELREYARDDQSPLQTVAQQAIETIDGYKITAVMLSGVANEDEFNLQFLRLNLGTLINAGEKLHAMVGNMWQVLFASDRVGQHPFFESVHIPTRRYGQELTAAQVLLQAFSIAESGEFARARHIDLQRFVKSHAQLEPDNQVVNEVAATLDALNEATSSAKEYLRNRAVTVSIVVLAWERDVRSGLLSVEQFWEFTEAFMGRLRWQVEKMKSFDVAAEYPHLVEFQRHLTQASVERPAVTRRDEILQSNLNQWLLDGRLIGDAEYEAATEGPPSG